MMSLRLVRRMSLLVTFAVPCLLTGGVGGQSGQPPLVPESFKLSEVARKAIDAEWMDEAERAERRVFHGVWDDRDLNTPLARAIVALNAWRLDDPAFEHPDVPVEIRAEAKLRAGDLAEAITLVAEADSVGSARVRAAASEALGDHEAALAALAPVVALLETGEPGDAETLTECVRALAVGARLQGQTAGEYETMISMLSRAHQDIDRLYWPAKLAEGELLLEKHSQRLAVDALHETLALNPQCAAAWYALGQIALARFDLDSARLAVEAIRRVDPRHPQADLLYARSRLVENDPEEALFVLRGVLDRWPRMRGALALRAGATALLFDEKAFQTALGAYEALSPGAPDAPYVAGRFLSMFRQYDQAAAMLEESMRRQPAWSAPRIELGLMEMQTGRDDKALAVLREAVELDPYNKRATNSLQLLEELSGYRALETDHFVIRYQPGVDEVMVQLMPEPLERIHATVAARFDWTPPEKTIIELMPDHKRFAVRITGMPHIHTIAACTGPIIALEVPREGKRSLHRGAFDWARVLQHEYTHTITLDQTRYRIPHWLTEAAAVSMEEAPRDYGDCLILAESYRTGTLFDLDEIKWAFVRPRRPDDRGKAYAQGHWMVEYMNERFGPRALIDLLERYFHGEREEQAIPNALGVSRAEFFEGFLDWAGAEVEGWGLAAEPSLTELTDELRWSDPDLAVVMEASRQARLDAIAAAIADRIGRPAGPRDRPLTAEQWPALVRPPVEIDDAQIASWRREHPDHPDLLELELRRRLERIETPDETLVPALSRYAELRPVDPFPDRRLAQIYLAGPDPARAMPHLEALDAREDKTPVYARRLADLYREAGELDLALDKITRAVGINPYHAANRELAAAIAVEAGRLDLARLHVEALTRLEPDRPQHRRRLDRIDELLRSRDRHG